MGGIMAAKKRVQSLCKEKDCQNAATTSGYCRLHYLKNWRKIRERQKKRAAASLNRYVERVMKKNPNNYLDTIKHDLQNAEQFREKVEDMFLDDEFLEVVEEVDLEREADRVLGGLTIDEIP
jgi:hypothetical protein